MKLCKNCKHFRSNWCEQPVLRETPDYVKGTVYYVPARTGASQRESDDPTMFGVRCGPSARYFEPSVWHHIKLFVGIG